LNNDYQYAIKIDRDSPVTYCAIYPPYFSFPFMESGDLQIGNVFTVPAKRGEGCARRFLFSLIHSENICTRRVWYVTHKNNLPSNRLVQSLGAQKVGELMRSTKMGFIPIYVPLFF
jgi:RimJ/RimL family protein N-acetyltransferase